MKKVATVTRLSANFIAIIFIILLSLCLASHVQGQYTYGQIAGAWNISYADGSTEYQLTISQELQEVNLQIYNLDLSSNIDFHFEIHADNEKVSHVDKRIERSDIIQQQNGSTTSSNSVWQGAVLVQTRHFGFTNLYVTLHPRNGAAVERSPGDLTLAVARKDRLDEKIFSYTASTLLLLMFLNLGAVLDLQRLKAIFLRPLAVSLGICTSYILMPALALALGYCCLPEKQELQLALFFTALSPSGGLANICTIFLKGNVNLSIATTTINSLLSLTMFPLWMLILTHTLFVNTELDVPLADLALSAGALICAIGLGILLRILLPKTTLVIIRFLKPFCACLSLTLIGMTVGINAFAFKELTPWIFLAAFFLPIIGFVVSFGLSKLLRCSASDAITISIETSVLNMTVPIILLQHSFDEVRSDMTLIVPIMAALLSLLMMAVIYTIRRIFGWNENLDTGAYNSKVYLVQNYSEKSELPR
ncbi:hepatic sodium/bile acid cotransporter [Eurosta solidaginis]|uniref:hepatic sodium/bile acid cotransporter n=1 Tax=Eurosta solidaginis TaxID=178769 RepID=UPI00353085AA